MGSLRLKRKKSLKRKKLVGGNCSLDNKKRILSAHKNLVSLLNMSKLCTSKKSQLAQGLPIVQSLLNNQDPRYKTGYDYGPDDRLGRGSRRGRDSRRGRGHARENKIEWPEYIVEII